MPRVLFILQDLSQVLVPDDVIRHCLVAAKGSPATIPEQCDIQRVHAESIGEADHGGCDLVLLDYRNPVDHETPSAVMATPAGVPVILLVAENSRGIVDDSIDCLEYAVVAHTSDLRAELTEAVNRAAQRHVLQKIHQELTRARQVQSAMLPATTPRIPGFEVAARSIPAGLVGGDFYEFASPVEGIHDFLIGDVTGHGFNAAIRMAETQAYFRSYMGNNDEMSPVDVLHEVNGLMTATCSEVPLFASAMIVRLDADRRTVSWAGAGHQGYLQYASVESIVMAASGPVLGCYAEAEFRMSEELPLREEDRIVLVTDGISETRSDQSKELFGVDRMLEELDRHSDAAPDHALKMLMMSVREFRGFATPKDDITVVLIHATSQEK